MVYAKDLFLGLAGIEFAWAAIQLTLKKGELPDFLVSSTFKMLGIMFFYVLLVEAPTWIPAVMDSFSQAAGGISGAGVHAFTPSSIIDQGLSIAAQLITSMSSQASPGFGSIVATGGGALGKYLLSAIIIGLSGLVIVAAFTLVAVQLLVTKRRVVHRDRWRGIDAGFPGKPLDIALRREIFWICYFGWHQVVRLAIDCRAGRKRSERVNPASCFNPKSVAV